MRVKYLDQGHNAVSQPGLEHGPFDPESSALTIRQPHLQHETSIKSYNVCPTSVAASSDAPKTRFCLPFRKHVRTCAEDIIQ